MVIYGSLINQVSNEINTEYHGGFILCLTIIDDKINDFALWQGWRSNSEKKAQLIQPNIKSIM